MPVSHFVKGPSVDSVSALISQSSELLSNPQERTSCNGSDAAKTSHIRIAIVVSHPIQYFAPWYRELAGMQGVDLKVFYCRPQSTRNHFDPGFAIEVRWDIPLLEGYSWEVLPGDMNAPLTFLGVDNPAVGSALESFKPEVVVIHGYAQRTMWRTAAWCKQNSVPIMIYSDSNGSASRAPWKRLAKSLIVRRFYKQLDGAYYTGENNRAYHRHYGITEDRLFYGPMAVDCARMTHSTGNSAQARYEIREKYGIPQDAFLVIFSGKLIPLKCTHHLLEAVHRCTQRELNVWCIFVGEGPERIRLEEFARKRKMYNAVLTGFVNQSSIGRYYAASDAVALMSWREAKGAPVAEAGVFGCPAILCDRIGCIGATDGARIGENALVYPWADVDALAECIARLCQDENLYRSMSDSARRIALSQDISIAASSLRGAAVKLRGLGKRG